jgi:hypothetical protein
VNSSHAQESIQIDSLGGLKNAELPLSKINLLIGPQASGKSLAAKLIYFCKSYPKEMINGVFEGLTLQRLHEKLTSRLSDYFGAAMSAGPFEVCYHNGDEHLRITRARGRAAKTEIEVSPFFKGEYSSMRRTYGKQAAKIEDSAADEGVDLTIRLQIRYYEKLAGHFSGRWGVQQIFVPAGRSYFSFLHGSIFSLLSNNIPLDPFVREFGSSYERYKNYAFRDAPKNAKSIALADTSSILKGRYERDRGEDFIRTLDDRRVPVSSSSSGQQEVLPLLVMLHYFMRMRTPLGGRSVYVEEPEAHLFPDTQKQLVELLVHAVRSGRSSSQVVLTTHSPYVCAAINNLILAGDVVAAGGTVQGITANEANILFEDISALSLVDGKARSIMDSEARLIDTRYLDSISEEFVHQREALGDALEAAQNGP